ncbi:Tyrosine recombinase XerD [compost metagenome]
MDNVRKAWSAVLKGADVTKFRWHDLRHTFASKLAMKGVPLNTIRDLLGHADLQVTLRYAHLAPDSKAAAVELI